MDPAFKYRQVYQDALGRVETVVEDPLSLGLHTYYAYDALDNLVTVCQGGTLSGASCSGGITEPANVPFDLPASQ